MIFRALCLLCVLLVGFSEAYSQPELDISFGGTGTVATDIADGTDVANAVLIQPDKKIVSVGTTNLQFSPQYFALSRHNPDGTIDTAFGTNGRVTLDLDPSAPNEGAYAAALQPDGKIVAAGYANFTNPTIGNFAIARYNTDGTLDQTFGSGGWVLTSLNHRITEIRGVAIAPDGKIVAAGFYFNGTNFQTLIASYSAGGVLEWTKTDIHGSASGVFNAAASIALQPDGKILTGGSFFTNEDGSDVSLVRYNPDGSYDTSFGVAGRIVVPSFSTEEFINAISIMPDGRIIAAGGSGPDFLLMRFLANGDPDMSFGKGGRTSVATNGESQAKGIYLRPNGKILLGGSNFVSEQGLVAVSFNADGSLDTSFSGDGVLIFTFDGYIGVGANAMAVDHLGRPILAGSASTRFALARLYTPDPEPVTLSGRTVTPDGTPIRGIRVGLTDSSGQTRWTITNPFGIFQFENVTTGQTCNLQVRGAKRHTFDLLNIGFNEATSVDLVGTPRPEKQVTAKAKAAALSDPRKN